MGIIYHHTNIDGLIGILKSKKLWATNINFLNDYNEYKIGIETLKKICDKHINLEVEEKHADLEAFYKSFLKTFYEKMLINLNERNHYIVSFTKSRDNLRQWMSYGAKNSSYAIGFDYEKLKNIKLGESSIASEHFTYCLHDVAYNMDDIEKHLSLESIYQGILVNKDNIHNYTISLINHILIGLCALKEPTFIDENETRMVLQDRKVGVFSEKIQYRSQAGVITPYIDVPFEYDSIVEIIIGPNTHKELASKGLMSLLKSHGIDCKINYTECSLRQF